MTYQTYFATKPTRFSVLVLTLLSLTLTGCGVNNIPTYEEEAKAKWSQVLSQYQRRSDLIPNLVKTVKGFAAHEKDVLQSVIEARSKATQTQINIPKDVLTNPAAFQKIQQAQGKLQGALGRLLAVVEKYPELKSSQNFLSLQSQLEGTENRVAVARKDYISAVKRFNTELKIIPGRWWKTYMYPESEAMETFTIAKEKMSVPDVNFDQK